MKTIQEKALDIANLVVEKDKAYGSAFDKAGEFLKLLYPNGVKPENYTDMLGIVRIFDKLSRIATDKKAFSEEPFADIIGYCLIALRRQIKNENSSVHVNVDNSIIQNINVNNDNTVGQMLDENFESIKKIDPFENYDLANYFDGEF